jgi:hypothetical protein
MAISSNGVAGLKPGVVDNAAARPASPFEGQMIFQKDTDQLLIWNGSAWVIPNSPAQNPQGLELVGQSSFTAISSASPLNLDGLFSSTYDNYRVEIEWLQNTSNGDLLLKFRDSGGAVSTNYSYESGGSYYSSGTGTFAGFNNAPTETQTSAYILPVVASFRGVASYDIFSPNLARETNMIGQIATSDASATLRRVSLTSKIRQNSSTVFVGLQLFTSAGTATGTIRVYGYRNS